MHTCHVPGGFLVWGGGSPRGAAQEPAGSPCMVERWIGLIMQRRLLPAADGGVRMLSAVPELGVKGGEAGGKAPAQGADLVQRKSASTSGPRFPRTPRSTSHSPRQSP